jgi:hypothetical protein
LDSAYASRELKRLIPPKLQNFTTLRIALEKMFREFNTEVATERKLEKLRQSSSA